MSSPFGVIFSKDIKLNTAVKNKLPRVLNTRGKIFIPPLP